MGTVALYLRQLEARLRDIPLREIWASGVNIAAERLRSGEADRAVGVGLSTALNLLAIWLLALSLVPIARDAVSQDVHATLFGTTDAERAPPSVPQLQSPAPSAVQAPTIQIEADSPSVAAASTAAMAQMLAPRPDPQHINAIE